MLRTQWSRREKMMGIGVGLVVVIAVLIWLGSGSDSSSSQTIPTYQPATPNTGNTNTYIPRKSTQIVVDVKGAVMKPGIYRCASTDRVYDAIQLAGGATAQADLNQIDLAQVLTDGMVVYVPRHGETIPTIFSSSAAGGQGTKININRATAEQLDQLNGIGPTRAQEIVKYRQDHGSFHRIEDIKNVPGIGDSTFNKFKDQITV